jgi:hypothetical protein
MAHSDSSGGDRPVDDRRKIGRYVGDSYLAPDGPWTMSEFMVLEPVQRTAVTELLRHCTSTEASAIRQWTGVPRGAALRLHANGNGYERETYLHRNRAGDFELIRRRQSTCTVCGSERVMFVYPDGSATCGLCELARD